MSHMNKSPFDDGDGKEPTRPAFSMGGNTDKLKEPDYGMDGGGNTTLVSWDEREIMSDTVSAVPCEYSDPSDMPEWCGHRGGVYSK